MAFSAEGGQKVASGKRATLCVAPAPGYRIVAPPALETLATFCVAPQALETDSHFMVGAWRRLCIDG